MQLETIVGLIMIAVFVVAISKRWLSPYAALAVCPFIAAVIYCLITGQPVLNVFDWIYEGVFYSVKEGGKVSAGTMRSALMILFACTYFTLMMQVGLFDPLVIGIIKLVKGDPLKIIIAATLVAAGVSLDGDGTSTVLITTAAFMPLFKQFKIKSSYLAILIALPTSVFNMAPWGGPLARVLSALDLDVTQVFPKLLPGMTVVMIYAILLAYFIGRKERARLGFDPKSSKSVTAEELEKMANVVRENNAELKRPKMIWYNLIVTIIIMYMLITGMANSALLFMTGIAFALVANYGFNFKEQKDRLAGALEDGMPACAMIVASGFLMGILNGSGMGSSMAHFLGGLVPAGQEGLLPIFTAVLGIPGLIFLSSDGYYFGILPVLASLASSYGISMTTMGVAAMVPLSTYYATPLIAWIFILCDRCEVEFADYQKSILKVGIPAFVLYIITFLVTGAISI
jgi:CitMHS family citrate-Mg2+:H+ or citrate-Ca2+:H+ symporter